MISYTGWLHFSPPLTILPFTNFSVKCKMDRCPSSTIGNKKITPALRFVVKTLFYFLFYFRIEMTKTSSSDLVKGENCK